MAAQMAPIMDRLGRILVDLSPHIAILGANLHKDLNHNISNLSILTNEGSLTSNNQK